MEETNEHLDPPPPLSISDEERDHIDSAIVWMANEGTRMGLKCVRLSDVHTHDDLGSSCDSLVSEALTKLSRKIKSDPAEKLLDRMARVVDSWKDDESQRVLGMIFVRLTDTMHYMVAYKGKFRGVDRKPSIPKSEALSVLRLRGLTRK